MDISLGIRKVLSYILFSIIITLSVITSVRAESCDSTDIARLKALAENVDVEYSYVGDNTDEDLLMDADYDDASEYYYYEYRVSVSGVTSELYFILDDERIFEYSPSGVITFGELAGELNVYVYSTACDEFLKKITINILHYNYYSTESFCEEYADYNFDVCKEWTEESIGYEEFMDVVSKYDTGDDESSTGILSLIRNNYIIAIAAVVVVFIVLVIAARRYRKRSVLE